MWGMWGLETKKPRTKPGLDVLKVKVHLTGILPFPGDEPALKVPDVRLPH